jgi:hypothetical protein
MERNQTPPFAVEVLEEGRIPPAVAEFARSAAVTADPTSVPEGAEVVLAEKDFGELVGPVQVRATRTPEGMRVKTWVVNTSRETCPHCQGWGCFFCNFRRSGSPEE